MNSIYTKDNFYIVITDFNGFEQTQKCLSALQASEFQNFTTIVIDHGTNDETQKGIKKEFPNVVRLKASPKLWWAGATNTGIKYALKHKATAVMLLNNDCYVNKATLDSLSILAYRQADAIIAPVQRDGTDQTILSINPRSNFLLGLPTIGGSKKITKKMLATELLSVKLISGGRGAIIPTTVFQAIGLFDEQNFPHYCADHDFYIRARKAGINLFTAINTSVDIDNSRTSTASQIDQLSFSQFKDTIINIRSHKNFSAVSALFQKHFPIRGIHSFGITLFYLRYIAVYIVTKTYATIRNPFSYKVTNTGYKYDDKIDK
jgi:GT2 family glycosyltransferase